MNTESKPDYFFSPSTVSFYPALMLDAYREAGTLPDDLVDIEYNVFAEFSGTPPDGKVRGVSKGKPAWVNMPPPTPEQMIAAAEMQKQRLLSGATTAIAPLQYAVDLGIATPKEISALKEWKTYMVMLNRVDTSPGADVIWPMPPASPAS